jgi:hypothetical protein
MQLPTINGSVTVEDFFIYGACDEKYFDDFGIPLINSIRANTKNQLHLHLFNPRQDQLDFCRDRISFTYEYMEDSVFTAAVDRWQTPPPEDSPDRIWYDRIIGAVKKGKDASILERTKKTYYACARFIRLGEILENRDIKCLAIDVDAVVRRPIPENLLDSELKMFKIEGAKARFLAGAIYFPSNDKSLEFLRKYSTVLRDSIERDYLYWSLDQTVLDEVMIGKTFSPMPASLIDWEMRLDSIIWTAKGSRKSLPIFQAELKKYTV